MKTKENYKISTITLTTQFKNCNINLFNVGKFLEIDDTITGIKYSQGNLNILKGSYLTTIYRKAKIKQKARVNNALFYNQVSLIIKIGDSNINVKLFGNGCLHMTGCKTPETGIEVTKIIYIRLNHLRNANYPIILSRNIHGVLLDKDNLIYSEETHQIIGFYKPETHIYTINKKEYTYDSNNIFIHTKMESKRIRHLIDFNGKMIGNCQIKLLKNHNKLFKNNGIYYDYENNLIYYNNDKVIGTLEYTIEKKKFNETKLNTEDVMIIDYSCNCFIPYDFKLDDFTKETIDLNVNCINIYFNLNVSINRQRLYDILLSQNLICKYNPEIYSGIKLIYKCPIDGKLINKGICSCSNKCTCLDIVFLIFQSGNIIVSGFKDKETIDLVVNDFLKILQPFIEIFKKRDVIY
jgi:TATA-box binding protein (TBP) (component of TFIID and TFIIIB)